MTAESQKASPKQEPEKTETTPESEPVHLVKSPTLELETEEEEADIDGAIF